MWWSSYHAANQKEEVDMKSIKELPPGTMFVFCHHLVSSESTSDYVSISNDIVWLNEVPDQIGYHGTCTICKSKYFSRPDGAF